MDASRSDDGVLLRYDDAKANRSLVLEDDNRVAYAYLLEEDEVVSDVWLYNVELTPEDVDWTEVTQSPFLNPRRFCREDERLLRLQADSNIHCEWSEGRVDVFVDGAWTARLEVGVKPGWSRLATEPGPLAKPLMDAPSTIPDGR